MHTPDEQQTSFSEEASKEKVGLIGEFIGFMREYAKWWLTPILLVFLLVAALVIFGSTGAAPFIYTLF